MSELFIRLYALLVCLYPRSFRAEFEGEMRAVFARALAEATGRGWIALAAVCLREFRDLPGALFRAHWHAIRNRSPGLASLRALLKREVEMTENNQNRERPASWTATLAGMAPFLLFGLLLTLGDLPHNWAVPTWYPYLRGALFLGAFVLLVIGFGIGWVKGFPRWSYPYVGLGLLVSLYMMRQATPGQRNTFGRPDLLGWRAWIPFLVMALVALLITRSLRPVFKLFTNVWEDWTLLTSGMFGFMPLLVAIGFDEVDRLYSLPFMVALTLVMAGTVLVYLRSTRPWSRVLALLVGIILTVTVATVAPTVYWLGNGWVNVGVQVRRGTNVVAVMLSPVLVGLLHRSIQHLRAA